MLRLQLLISLVVISGAFTQDIKSDYKKFVGKEIQVILKESEFSGYREYRYLNEPPSVLIGIIFKYDNKYLELYVDDFEHVEKYAPNLDWKFEYVKQEKIARIRIFDKDKLLYDSKS